jgi:hypothetical protein
MMHANRISVFFFLLAACQLGIAGEPTLDPFVQAKGKIVVAVNVEGVTGADLERVLGAMVTKKGRPFDPAVYRQDYLRIFDLSLCEASDIILHAPKVTEAGVHLIVTCRKRTAPTPAQASSTDQGADDAKKAERTQYPGGDSAEPASGHRWAWVTAGLVVAALVLVGALLFLRRRK